MQVYSKNKGRKHKIETSKMFFIIAYAMFDGVNTARTIKDATFMRMKKDYMKNG